MQEKKEESLDAGQGKQKNQNKAASAETAADKEEKEKKPDLEDLQKQLEDLKKQKDEYLAGWQRERADFLNYKKEEMERISSLVNYSNEEIVLNFLPILDNFDIVEKKLTEGQRKDAGVQGLLLTGKQMKDFIKKFGVEEVKAVGEKFDPRFHEVIEEVEIKDGVKGIIIEEIQKGYKANGRLLRAAKVKVVK